MLQKTNLKHKIIFFEYKKYAELDNVFKIESEKLDFVNNAIMKLQTKPADTFSGTKKVSPAELRMKIKKHLQGKKQFGTVHNIDSYIMDLIVPKGNNL